MIDATRAIRAGGVRRVLPPVSRHALAGSASAFLSTMSPADDASALVGVFPFDDSVPAHLFEPETFEMLELGSDLPVVLASNESVTSALRFVAEPSRAAYAESVDRAIRRLCQDPPELRKVVLARTLAVHNHSTIDVASVLAKLQRDRSVNTFSVSLPPSPDGLPRTFVGATPEMLIDKSGKEISSLPLAGSARRLANIEQDQAAGQRLLNSSKDLVEHRHVIESIADLLTPYCQSLTVPRRPSLLSTASIWHLGTRIEGVLRSEDTPSLELAMLLHPTPAVCGSPRALAREVIAELETFDRGYFTGGVGYTDARGDGRWYVAIRCAEISGTRARLYAGAGIVDCSDAYGEVLETETKFAPMLRALGIAAENA
ncbi:MAG: isochorismate synthase [Gemmatimonas sp.]